jgi:SAM-dependent methyltransferase
MNMRAASVADDNACPACQSLRPDATHANIAHCGKCNHRWLARDVETQSRIEAEIYTRDYAGYREDPRLVQSFRILMKEQFIPRVPVPGQILDVGCGGGTFLKAAGEAGFNAVGLDVSEAAAGLCKDRGLNASSGDFLEFRPPVPFSAVTFWDVFEHLRQPAQFLAHGLSLLRRGGVLIGKVPMFGSLSVSLSDQIPRLGGTLLGTPEHLQFFNEQSLSTMLNATGHKWEFLPLEGGAMRSPAQGGSIVKRTARLAKTKISRLSGDRNALFLVEVS